MVLLQDDDPACPNVFDFDFEKESCANGGEIPKDKLQALMYSERLSLRPIVADGDAKKRGNEDAEESAPKKQKTES